MLSSKMQHHEFEPPQNLSDAIKCFWYTGKDFGQQQSRFEVQPDGFAEIIFHFGSNLNVSVDEILQPLPSPFMMGLLNQPAVFYVKNQLEIIAVRCFPWTVFDLLGLPSGKGGMRFLEHPIAKLQPVLEDLINAGKIAEAVCKVKDYFLDQFPTAVTDSTLSKAGIAMSGANGTMPVSKVAAAAHSTIRTLERKFKQSSGHTVKDVSALMRFEQVRNQLWNDPDSGIAGLSQEFGYTDQSHLSREFKRFSGTTPAAFARKAKHWKQMTDDDFVAFVQA